MLRPEDIQQRLRQQPFQPFRIICTEGLRYEIQHPDLVLIGARSLTIGFATETRPGIYDRIIPVALIHVVAIEEIPSKVAQS